MTPHIPRGAKGFEIDRRFPEVGRLRIATGTKSKRLYRQYDALLTELHDAGRLDVLNALRDHELTIREVMDAKRRGASLDKRSNVLLRRELWPAVDEWLEVAAKAESSRKRYAVSFAKLDRLNVLGESAQIADLARVEWSKLRKGWGSGADWNRMRAAVSRFLTMTLGDKWHPFRRDVVSRIPRAREPKRHRPDITPEIFRGILDRVPEYVRPAYVVLAATGMRPGEYLALTEDHLRPDIHAIQVPGTKTEGSERLIKIEPELWPWVEAGVPSPLRYKWLRIHYKRAVRKLGKDYRLYDLRHLFGHICSDAGLSDAKVGTALGHESAATTRRYTEQAYASETARAVGEWMKEAVG